MRPRHAERRVHLALCVILLQTSQECCGDGVSLRFRAGTPLVDLKSARAGGIPVEELPARIGSCSLLASYFRRLRLRGGGRKFCSKSKGFSRQGTPHAARPKWTKGHLKRDLQHGGAKGGPKRGMHESEGSRLLKGSAKMAPPIHVEDDEQGGGGEPVKKPVGRLLRARLKWKNPHVHGKKLSCDSALPPKS